MTAPLPAGGGGAVGAISSVGAPAGFMGAPDMLRGGVQSYDPVPGKWVIWLPGAPETLVHPSEMSEWHPLVAAMPEGYVVVIFGMKAGRIVLDRPQDRADTSTAMDLLLEILRDELPDITPILLVPGAGQVAGELARALGMDVVSMPGGLPTAATRDTARLTPFGQPGPASQAPDGPLRRYRPDDLVGEAVTEAWAAELVAHIRHRPTPPMPGRVWADPMVRSVGVPKAGLPYLPLLLQAVRRELESARHDVPAEEWESLPEKLLSSYTFLLGGLPVPLGSVEVLFTLDPANPIPVGNPAASTAAAVDSVPANDDLTFVGNETINAAYNLGAHTGTHAGLTSATRGSLSALFSVPLGPVILKAGPRFGGVTNQSSRTTFRLQEAESGHVQDDRGEHDLVAYEPNWSFKIRARLDERWQDITPHHLPDPGTEDLLLWIPHHYLIPPSTQTTHDVDEVSARRLPPNLYSSGMTNLPLLADLVMAELAQLGLRLRMGSRTRRQLHYMLWNIDANLEKAVNDKQGYPFALHDAYGKPIAWVEVHSRRLGEAPADSGTDGEAHEDEAHEDGAYEDGAYEDEFIVAGTESTAERAPLAPRRVGSSSSKAHLETPRTAIDAVGGTHTITSQTAFNLGVEVDAWGFLGFLVSGGVTYSRVDGISSSRVGLNVQVPRYTGVTTGYEVWYEHTVKVSVRDTWYRPWASSAGRSRTTDPVQSRSLLRLVADEAAAHGFPVDATDVIPEEVEPDTEITRSIPAEPATEEPSLPEPGTRQRAAADPRTTEPESESVWPDKRATDEMDGDEREHRAIDPPPLESDQWSLTSGSGSSTSMYGPASYAPSLASSVLPEQPLHLAWGKGIGTGVVWVEQATADAILQYLKTQLRQRGFIPPDEDSPFGSLSRWGHGKKRSRQVENLLFLHRIVTASSLSAQFDMNHQDGLHITLSLERGFGGSNFDVDSARITIKAISAGPPEYDGRAEDISAVNLTMGLDTAGQMTGGSTALTLLSFRLKLLHSLLRFGMTGGELRYGWGINDVVTYVNNQPQLNEWEKNLLRYRMVDDYVIKIEFQHRGVPGKIRAGSRDPEEWRLPGQVATAAVPPIGSEAGPTSERPTPPDVLARATIFYLDSSGAVDALAGLLPELTYPGGPADEEVRSFTSNINLRAHLKEIVWHTYTTDQFVDPGVLRDAHALADISGDMHESTYLGASADPNVIGIIGLWLAQANSTTNRQLGLYADLFDIGLGQDVGQVTLTGEFDVNRLWEEARAVMSGGTGGEELIQLDFGRWYLFGTTVDLTVRARQEKHGKLAPAGYHRPEPVVLEQRRMLYTLSESEALTWYARGDLPIPDDDLDKAIGRWRSGELTISGNVVASVLLTWQEKSEHEFAGQRREYVDLLVAAHRAGALPVLDEAVRTRFETAFEVELPARDDLYHEIQLPEYFTRKDPAGRVLGHHGMVEVTYAGGKSAYDIVRREVDLAVPGLLTGEVELWDAKGRVLGRLQGAVDALQAILAQGRDMSAWEDLSGPDGISLYLVNQIGWLLTNIVEIKIRDAQTSTPKVYDFQPSAGIETYQHQYRTKGKSSTRHGALGVMPLKFSPSGGPGRGFVDLKTAENHYRTGADAETAIAEQTGYAWSGTYRFEVDHELSVEVNQLEMAGRPLANALFRGFAGGHRTRARKPVTAAGKLRVEVPRGIAEAGRLHGPDLMRDLVTLSVDLPGDRFRHGVLLDDVLPVANRLLARAFGSRVGAALGSLSSAGRLTKRRTPGRSRPRQRTNLSLATVLNHSNLTNHLPEGLSSGGYELPGEHFVPGSSNTRVKLWLVGGLTDLTVYGRVKEGVGVGRYSKHQSGTTAGARSDQWMPSTDASVGGTMNLGHDLTLGLDPQITAQAQAGVATADTRVDRPEAHGKQIGGALVQVRLRGRYRLEAEKRRYHALGLRWRRGRYRSEPITGDVYAQLFEGEVRSLQERLAVNRHTAGRPLPRLDKATTLEFTAMLTAAAARGHRDVALYQDVVRQIRDGSKPGRPVILSEESLSAEFYKTMLRWAVPTMHSALLADAVPTPRTRRRLAEYERLLYRLNMEGYLPDDHSEATEEILSEVDGLHGLRPDNPTGEPAPRTPAVAAFLTDSAHFGQYAATELGTTVVFQSNRRIWTSPDGHLVDESWVGDAARTRAIRVDLNTLNPAAAIAGGATQEETHQNAVRHVRDRLRRGRPAVLTVDTHAWWVDSYRAVLPWTVVTIDAAVGPGSVEDLPEHLADRLDDYREHLERLEREGYVPGDPRTAVYDLLRSVEEVLDGLGDDFAGPGRREDSEAIIARFYWSLSIRGQAGDIARTLRTAIGLQTRPARQQTGDPRTYHPPRVTEAALATAARLDLAPLLGSASRRTEAVNAYQDVARQIIERVGPDHPVILTVDPATWSAERYRAVLPAALSAMQQMAAAGIGHELDSPLAEYEKLAYRLRMENHVPEDPDRRTGEILTKLQELHNVRTDTDSPLPELPSAVGIFAGDPLFLARSVAHELDTLVRLDTLVQRGDDGLARGWRIGQWIDPEGRVYAFDPGTFDDSRVSFEQAQSAGLLPTREEYASPLRSGMQTFGITDQDLGRLYRTSWSGRQTLEQALAAEISRRYSVLTSDPDYFEERDPDRRLTRLFRRMDRALAEFGPRSLETLAWAIDGDGTHADDGEPLHVNAAMVRATSAAFARGPEVYQQIQNHVWPVVPELSLSAKVDWILWLHEQELAHQRERAELFAVAAAVAHCADSDDAKRR